jgi:CRP-like cAMP-binding protein
MVRKTYRKDEVLAEEGAKLGSLVIVRTGVLVVSCHSEEGELELSRLAPGDFFGDSSFFADHGEPGTIKALAFSVVYEVGQEALAKIMRQRPTLAEEICLTLSRRGKAGRAGDAHDGDEAAGISMTELLTRIRHLFAVPHQ